MSLLHPALLWAAPAVALPILAHLLSSKTLTVVPFAPIAWLTPTAARSQGRHRLHGPLLLALRVLALATVVLLCAHPMARRPAAPETAAVSASHGVLVVDASASMNYRTPKGTLIAAAKDMATAHVTQAPPHVAWALVVLGEDEARSRPFMTDAQTVRHTLASSIPAHGDGVADLGRGIEQAMRLLTEAQAQGSIVVISDLSRTSLLHGLPSAWTSNPEGAPALVWLDAAARSEDAGGALNPLGNVAITDLRVRPGAGIEVDVHNFGVAAVEGRGLTVRMEGGESLRGLVTVPAGATVHKLLPLGVQTSGTVTVSAVLDAVGEAADGYGADDHLERALTFAPPIRVLAIDGAPHSRARASELFFAERALAEAPRAQGAIATTVVARAELLRALTTTDGTAAYDVIVMANVGRVTAQEGQALLAARRRGMGLVVGLGDSILLDNDQDALAYQTFVPFELRDAAQRAQPAASFSSLALSHPVLAQLGDAAVAALRRVRTDQYLFVAPEAGQRSEVIIAYDDGAPALIESPAAMGLGSVLLWTSSLDADWTTLPLMGVYVPLLQRMVVQAAQRNLPLVDQSAAALASRHGLLESDFTPLAPDVLRQGQSALGRSGPVSTASTRDPGTVWVMPLASLLWLVVAAEMMVAFRKLAPKPRRMVF